MQRARALKQFGAVLVAGACLLLDGCAVPTARTQMAALPADEVASLEAVLAADFPPTTLVATPVTVLAPAPAAAPAPFAYPTAPEQWFQPSGGHMGTEGLALFLAGIALVDNTPLYISEQANRTTGPDTSDHYYARTDSWAVDVAVRGIQVPTPQTYLAAKRISTALGESNWPGGDLTKIINGYRFQVLWLVDGHFNHVHVGVRKI